LASVTVPKTLTAEWEKATLKFQKAAGADPIWNAKNSILNKK
jgi:hypothetical protein